ncbi:type I restriction-modification system endonuclease [Paenibacillus campi]|uniref:type I restriction-modification system endonuclease n=1 Tax=Paenibacillus campi TaxID=3106031 RepID=UPI002B002494|nr:type I restriction-modification system endonuclease [Paenibacillus sp. SGZ-1014]
MASQNFHFLADRWEVLDKVAEIAERNIYQDPNTALSKLRTFAETMAKYISAFEQMNEDQLNNQHTRLTQFKNQQIIPDEIITLFHTIRTKGNVAVHNPTYGSTDEAKALLHIAFRIAVWFMEVYGTWDFQVPTYAEPTKESNITETELQQITYNYEQKLVGLEAELQELRAERSSETPSNKSNRRQRSQRLSSNLNLTEAETRMLIDEQLREKGWEADTIHIRYSKGACPEKGKNKAIAEWPFEEGVADYALFVGLTLIGIVEAKRTSKDIPNDIEQAKKYSKAVVRRGEEDILAPWGEYFVPFLFASNGRPYLKQFEQKSGIWFLDARRSTNHARALQDWYRPEELEQLLKQNVDEAEQKLRDEKFEYLGLRPYQVTAIQKVEEAVRVGKREILLAMATGTGKTRMSIGLIYRLVKSGRFNRILFLVDREALGQQAENAFKESRLENQHTFTETYELQMLKDKKPNKETRVHIATVQGMLKRLFYSQSMQDQPSVGQYDCIIVDEAHRGYTLDKDMSEFEIEIRDHNDYVSKYRQVLEYFDAVKIGLTATPALHTTEIFGAPVYTYSYREAVIEGYLIDHEPPYQFDTVLKQNGITFEKGSEVDVYDTVNNQLSKEYMEDEVNIEVAQFNTKVITDSFNEVILRNLTDYISPYDEGKTLIFAATDAHADKVVDILKKEYDALYDGVEDNAIMKITGSIHHPSEAIRRFKNERLPNIVVTVDLLTTGIDVPEITNLVFLRRVKSRILFEQMLGRATRRCDGINKDHFKIFDAVNIYEALQNYTDMKPVVTRPKVPVLQLVNELDRIEEPDKLKEQQEQILAKIRRKQRHFTAAREENFGLLSDGRTVEEFAQWVESIEPDVLYEQLQPYLRLFHYLDENRDGENKQIISEHEDEFIGITRGYGNAEKPEDYLDSFGEYIRNHMNTIPALIIVCQRPADLTREDLKRLRFELDQAGYTEQNLMTAWREVKNEDITADIIAFIRQQALGDPLMNHADRVRNAMKKIYSKQVWPPKQKLWLERIEKQLLKESVLGPNVEQAFNYEPFMSHGGYRQMDRVFKGELSEILREINTNLYSNEMKEKA